MGLRPYKELTPMHRSQIDLENGVVHIPDSKTQNGIADMPMTDLANEALRRRLEATSGSEWRSPFKWLPFSYGPPEERQRGAAWVSPSVMAWKRCERSKLVKKKRCSNRESLWRFVPANRSG
jgi:hypothetical protein